MAGGGGQIEEDGGGSSGNNVFGEPPSAPVTLNLTALMDILSNLLFFLLAAFGATIVMAINASVPVQSPDKSDMADTQKSVTVNVVLTKEGFDISILRATLTPEEQQKWQKRIPLRDGTHDFATLSAHLLGIKEQYSKSDTMILVPEQETDYETMVKTMDAARETQVNVGGQMRLIPVLPTVVVSTVIK
jgi:biopolymer transport protein ExbD